MTDNRDAASTSLERKLEMQADEIERLTKGHQQLLDAQFEMMGLVRSFVTNFPFGLIVINKDQTINSVNKLAEEFFQYSKDDLAQKPISVIFPELNKLEVTGKPLRTMGCRSTGEKFVAEVFVNVLGIGQDERLFVSVQDITERHRLEQLRQDLMGMVSHDLRAPLTTIRVTLDMVRDGIYGTLNERGELAIDRAVSSTQYLSSMVANLLDADKAESGTISLVIEETTIGAIVKQAIGALEKSTDSGSLSIDSDFTNDAVKVDRDRIVQVLINLISNAMKYSPPDAKVMVKAGIEGLSAKFQVIDRGPGIPKELQPLIFERYRQLDQPRGIKQKGFGLGLAICKALVELHKGRIWVESEESKGSKFMFTVPISQD